ncbi:uncharacterized protein EV420DRAFT_1584910 [Desarmillaria tabescens]|uniref:CBM1 domain-containing protein n=1 Tax=Armillaria tabescens TaxID=1929756 RepID=A0AA39JBP0_ARMTA|nr:uncharacterized protein EV420DRAFT_1584910 [Desarmillaria tabescens]KAK0439035.1 hypothetical protein EV420DRAFT_1584910 [Desarmillaria tabescens]
MLVRLITGLALSVVLISVDTTVAGAVCSGSYACDSSDRYINSCKWGSDVCVRSFDGHPKTLEGRSNFMKVEILCFGHNAYVILATHQSGLPWTSLHPLSRSEA